MGRGLMDGNGIVYSAIHGAGLDSVCTRGWEWWDGELGGSGGSGGLDSGCVMFGWVRVLSLHR